MYWFYYVNDLWAVLIERAVWMFSKEYIVIFTVVPCILILSKCYYQLMHKRNALKGVVKLTLKMLQHVSVQSPSSGSALYELAKVAFVKTVS